jgi:hypothetical protein
MGISYLAIPVSDPKQPSGKQGRAIWSNDKYMDSLFTNPIKNVFPKIKHDSLHINTFFLVGLDTKGDIIYCKFFVNYRDTALITEDDLYNLYLRFKKIKVDMTLVKIVPDANTDWKYADYAEIFGSLMSKEARYKFNKEYQDRIPKKQQ